MESHIRIISEELALYFQVRWALSSFLALTLLQRFYFGIVTKDPLLTLKANQTYFLDHL